MGFDRRAIAAHRPRGERPFGEPHGVVAEGPARVAMAIAAELVRQVLDQRPPAGHVQELHAAADAEDRHVALERPVGQGELEAVALGPGVTGLRVYPRAVGGGIDVGAAGQHEAVDQVEHLAGVLRGGVIRR